MSAARRRQRRGRCLPDGDVLEQVATGVVVIDRDGNLLYANSFAVTLFGFPDDAEHLVGRSLLSLGFEEGDAAQGADMARTRCCAAGPGRARSRACASTGPGSSSGAQAAAAAHPTARSPAS